MTPTNKYKTKPVTDENYITLKEYMEDKFLMSDKALELATKVLDVRLTAMNNFREQMQSERDTFLTKDEYEVNHSLLESKIEIVQKFMWVLTGGLVVMELVLRFIK
jgi:hypothetical protein